MFWVHYATDSFFEGLVLGFWMVWINTHPLTLVNIYSFTSVGNLISQASEMKKKLTRSSVWDIEITEVKVLAQMLFVVTGLTICNKSISFQQDFQLEIISNWELGRVQVWAVVKKEMPCKQKGNSYSRQKEKEYQISEHPHAFTGCQNLIPSNNHPEDTP